MSCAVEADVAGVRGAFDQVVHAVELPQERRFAAARRADQRHHRAFRNGQRHVPDRGLAAKKTDKLRTSILLAASRRSGDDRPDVVRSVIGADRRESPRIIPGVCSYRAPHFIYSRDMCVFDEAVCNSAHFIS